LLLVLQKYLDVLLFIAFIITFILDIVNLCQTIVDHMSILNAVDSGLHMSTGTGGGTGAGSGTNLQGNSGIPNGPNGSDGNPGGLPGGNNEGFGSYTTERRFIYNDGS
jgi:hypothetical protein